MLNSIGRIIVAIVTYLLFKEFFGWQKGVAIVFVFLGFILYIYAGAITKRIKNHGALEMMTRDETESAESGWSSAEVQNKENS